MPREKICCGYVYKGQCGELLVDPRYIQRCCIGTPLPASLEQAEEDKDFSEEMRNEMYAFEENYADDKDMFETCAVKTKPRRALLYPRQATKNVVYNESKDDTSDKDSLYADEELSCSDHFDGVQQTDAALLTDFASAFVS